MKNGLSKFNIIPIDSMNDVMCPTCIYFRTTDEKISCLNRSSKCGLTGVCPSGKWIIRSVYNKEIKCLSFDVLNVHLFHCILDNKICEIMTQK